jgi:hypothetical protein
MGPVTPPSCNCAHIPPTMPTCRGYHLPTCPMAQFERCDAPTSFARNEDRCHCGLLFSEHTADHRDPPVRETARPIHDIIQNADGNPLNIAFLIDGVQRAADAFLEYFSGSADPGVQELLRLVEQVAEFDDVTVDEEGWVVARRAARHDAGTTDLYASYVLDEDRE